jgi:hypothetical protein
MPIVLISESLLRRSTVKDGSILRDRQLCVPHGIGLIPEHSQPLHRCYVGLSEIDVTGVLVRIHDTLYGLMQNDPSNSELKNLQTAMDLSLALRAHLQWKRKLQDAIETGEALDVDTIKRDDCCDLGRWLHGDGELTFGSRVEFTKLVHAHSEFHVVTGLIAGIINNKEFDDAIKMLLGNNHFETASRAVGIAITDLKKASQ